MVQDISKKRLFPLELSILSNSEKTEIDCWLVCLSNVVRIATPSLQKEDCCIRYFSSTARFHPSVSTLRYWKLETAGMSLESITAFPGCGSFVDWYLEWVQRISVVCQAQAATMSQSQGALMVTLNNAQCRHNWVIMVLHFIYDLYDNCILECLGQLDFLYMDIKTINAPIKGLFWPTTTWQKQ